MHLTKVPQLSWMKGQTYIVHFIPFYTFSNLRRFNGDTQRIINEINPETYFLQKVLSMASSCHRIFESFIASQLSNIFLKRIVI